MKRFNLSEAATAILEGAKETFDANIAAKQGQRGGDSHKRGAVGQDKLSASVAYGEKEAGLVGTSPEEQDDHLPDYLKGTPTATPPGATPPVGSEPMKHLSKDRSYAPSPQETQGRKDLVKTQQASANEYEAIRDRKASHLAPQTFEKNHGATFQSYAEDVDLSDDVRALLEGENLSEEFAQKATTIFEAAVVSRINQIAEGIQSELAEQFDEAVDTIKEELASKIDEYLNYMAEEWMTENKLAVETGLRAEIAEEFISGLRNLFVEHYIDIPEDKVDVVEEMAGRIADLEDELNEEITKNIGLAKEINEQKKVEAIYAVCEGLTQTQAEKLRALAEGVEFTTEEEFASKLETLKESYFNTVVKVADTSALDDEVHIEEEKKVSTGSSDPLMEQYVNVISKTLVK
jgi:hypothetical protein